MTMTRKQSTLYDLEELYANRAILYCD